jgi:malonyl-CoA O-methyltransferase
MHPNLRNRNRYQRHAGLFEQTARISHEIGQRLFERLDYLKIKPNYILDLGCGPGIFSKQLRARYPQAIVVSLDDMAIMLAQTKIKQTWRKRWPLIAADMHALPFADGVFDLVFSNQVFHLSSSFPIIVAELSRVMNQQGCLMFSMLGPDTFKEFRAYSFIHNVTLTDMHHVGDCLLAEKFLDPVMDMEILTAHYKDLPTLLTSLRTQGVQHQRSVSHQGLIGRKSWQMMMSAANHLRTIDEKFPLTYEVVYGHAWKGMQRRLDKGMETFIPISTLRKHAPKV